MKINARIGLNGNSREDFFAAFLGCKEALLTIEGAREGLITNVLHSRNYQHMDDAREALDAASADREAMHDLIKQAHSAIGKLQDAVIATMTANEA